MSQQKLISYCHNPILLFNKASIRHLIRESFFVVHGEPIYLDNSDIKNLMYGKRIPYKIFYYKHKLQDIYDYIVPDEYGNAVPLFNYVGCGKCPFCRDKQTRAWQIRCMNESKYSTSPTLSVLLTYDNEHIPTYGLEPKHLTDFFKRLRISLKRNFECYQDNLRYYAVGEYGKERKRPHYHLILWNLPDFDFNPQLNIYMVNEFIQECWGNGFTSTRYTEDNSGDTKRCVKYYVKYLGKDCLIPNYRKYEEDDLGRVSFKLVPCTKPFMRCSRGNGTTKGIGYQWIQDNKANIIDNELYYNKMTFKFNDEKIEAYLPKYYMRYILPTLKELIPKKIRDSYTRFLMYIPYMIAHEDKYIFNHISYSLIDYVTDMQNKFWFLPQELPSLHNQYSELYVQNIMMPTLHMLEDYVIPYEKLNILLNKRYPYESMINERIRTSDPIFIDSNYYVIKSISSLTIKNVQSDGQ